jgi:formate dehydrogenase subunit gamma
MDSHAVVARILVAHRDRPGALLPVLHEIQDVLGFIPSDTVASIAGALNLSRAEVHGVISYYHHFRDVPPARHVLRFCCAEACQAAGGEALAEHARARLAGTDVALEPVYCLGLCACGPALQIDETTLHGQVTPTRLDALIDELEAGR